MKVQAGVAFLDRPEFEHLIERFRADGPRFNAEVPIRERIGDDIRGRLGLLVYDNQVVFVGRLVRGRTAGDTRRTFRVESADPINPPLAIGQIREGLLRSQRGPTYDPGGTLTAKATQGAIEVLLRERPGIATLIDELLALNSLRVSREEKIPVVQQRDAVAVLLDTAGLRPSPEFIDDRSWLDDGRVTFLPETTTGAPLEDPMIEHDRSVFLGWRPRETDTLGIRTFSNGNGKNLHIMNVNRWGIETALGVDLLYYHVQHRSFALLQYKRMTIETSDKWIYRPDKHFEKQQARMTALDEACEAFTQNEYRLTSAPCFLKLCQLESLDVDSLSTISGMYLANKQASMHLASDRALGRGLGKHFSFDNVVGYLTGSLFTNLLAHGLLGTTGSSTDLVRETLDASLNQRGAAVFGILDDARGRRPGWKEDATVA